MDITLAVGADLICRVPYCLGRLTLNQNVKDKTLAIE